jgi:hypothetical protein
LRSPGRQIDGESLHVAVIIETWPPMNAGFSIGLWH